MNKNALLKRIGFVLRQLRLERGISQEELAFDCNLHRTYVGSIERAEKGLSIMTLQKFATALNVPMSEIIRLAEQQTPEIDGI